MNNLGAVLVVCVIAAGCGGGSGAARDGAAGAGGTGAAGAGGAGAASDAGVDGGRVDAAAEGPAPGEGGFFLRGHVDLVGAEPDVVTFTVADDLGRSVPVFVHMGAPDYWLEVPPLPDVTRLYKLTFAAPGYASVTMGRIFKPGFSGTAVSDTFVVPIAALTAGVVAGRTVGISGVTGMPRTGVGAAIVPGSGAIVIAGANNYRLLRGGPAGVTITELPDAPRSEISLDCTIPSTPDGRFALLPETSLPPVVIHRHALLDLVSARVVARVPQLATSVSHSGEHFPDEIGILNASPDGSFAVAKRALQDEETGTDQHGAVLLRFDGAAVTQTVLPVETDGFTPDGSTFLAEAIGSPTVSAYDRASGAVTSFGVKWSELFGPALLTFDASRVLVARPFATATTKGGSFGQCWREDGCALTLLGAGGADPRALPGAALRYAVSTTRRAVMYVVSDAVVAHDVDTNQTTSTPLTYTKGLLGNELVQRILHGSIVTNDRLTVLNAEGVHVFDVATGKRLATIAGLWKELRPFAGDVLGLDGTCDGVRCFALLDTRAATATILAGGFLGPGGYHAGGARRWKKTLDPAGNVLGLQTGKAEDDGNRWLPISQGGGTDGVCGYTWPETYRAPCVLYRRPSLGLLAADPEADTLCAP